MVVAVGLTLTLVALDDVLHVYVVTPFADNVAVEPEHIVAEFTEIDGADVTLTEAVVVFTQPAAEVPTTV